MKKNDGGPAYPFTENRMNSNGGYEQHTGMSLRDAMAMAALPTLVAGMYKSIANGSYKIDARKGAMSFAALIAEEAYVQADAMLAERDK